MNDPALNDSQEIENSEPELESSSSPLVPKAPQRLLSLDAMRGLTMLLMASSAFGLYRVADQFPESNTWQEVKYQFSHVAWSWGGLWDMIQPSFTFLVGVSMAYSYAKRKERGDSWSRMALHAFYRAFLLIALGVLLRSWWTFEDVLAQIGLGYFFLFLFWGRSFRTIAIGIGAILVGYWALFAFWPLPNANYDYQAVGVSAAWLEANGFQGFAAHWNMNANPAHYFDQWWLNLFPQSDGEWTHNGGGYQTLSFIPSLATMLLGLIAGEWIRSDRSARKKILYLLLLGIVGVALSWILHTTGICPVVKKIWTPSWVLYSGGIVGMTLAVFYGLIDGIKFSPFRWIAYPAVVVGVNSIAIYVMTKLLPGYLSRTIKGLAGPDIFKKFDGMAQVMVEGNLIEKAVSYEPIVERAAILLILWFICWRMYRNRVFIRI